MSANTCTCTRDGYSPDCPQTFMQGGVLLHTIQNEMCLKPRQYLEPDLASSYGGEGTSEGGSSSAQGPTDQGEGTGPGDEGDPIRPLVPGRPNVWDFQHVEETLPVGPSRSTNPRCDPSYITDDGLQSGQRGSLERFRPLTINGVTMTQASIGGFRLDLAKTTAKAAEFVPLPPAVLPVIFRDPELNFNHHFFQGMETLAGSDLIERVVKAGTYSEGDRGLIMPVLKKLLTSGYVESDTELTTFVKKVLSGTSDTVPTSSLGGAQDCFIVSANLWGFPYIEQGMQCRESDLKMWMHMAHTSYRMSWFNNFKSSGVPSFAVEGVQARCDGAQKGETSSRGDLKVRLPRDYRDRSDRVRRAQDGRAGPGRSHRREESTLAKGKGNRIWSSLI